MSKNKNVFKTSLLAAAAVAGALTVSFAQAADVGQCGTPQQMSEILRQEGQSSLAFGNQRILGEIQPDGTIRTVNKEVGLVFTSDDSGRVGYLLQLDQPIGTPATKMCVSLRMQSVKLYDVRKPGIAQEVLVNSTENAAAHKCDDLASAGKIGRASCGFLNTMLAKAASQGERPMIQAEGVLRHTDGTYRPDGNKIVITANMAQSGSSNYGQGAVLFSVMPEGASIIASTFTNATYTQKALGKR